MVSSIANDYDKILGALANLFATDGDTRAVSILAQATATVRDTEYDNWDGGQTGFTFYLEIPQSLYHRLDGKQGEIEESFKKRSEELSRLYNNEWIAGFVITTELARDPEWREKAAQWCDMNDETDKFKVDGEIVIKASTPDPERYPDLSKIRRAVLKNSDRVRKVVSHTVIVDRHTQAVHHDAITIKTWKKGKNQSSVDFDHSVSLSSEDDDEIQKLMTFLLSVRKGMSTDGTGKFVVIDASTVPEPERLQELLNSVSAKGKAETFAAVLQAATDDVEVFQALIDRAAKDPHAFAEAGAALNLAAYKAAVEQLELLINTDGTREAAFQKHLEAYPWMFGSEYSERLERRKWTRDENKDFVVRRTTDGYIELIEIKTPLEGAILFNHDTSHDSYYPIADLSKVIGQVQKYIEKLDAARDSIRANDDEDTHKIRAKIVIGRDGDEKQRNALRSLNGHLHRIEIITFDQLLRIARRVISYLGSSLERAVVIEENPPESHTF